MTGAELALWVLALPAWLDGHGRTIPRIPAVAEAIAAVAAEQPGDTRLMAVVLDVLAAHEGAYRIASRGDHGRSCGSWQTPCARTPMAGADLAVRQARVAAAMWAQAVQRCPNHPAWAYASGRCSRSWAADLYEREIRSTMAAEAAR